MSEHFLKLIEGGNLQMEDYRAIFADLLDGAFNDTQVAAALTAMRCRGEDRSLLTAGALELRERATKLTVSSALRPLADNCGTGGSGKAKFNVSTAAAILAAACGVNLAKHGNRSSSGTCGSADFLFGLGFPETMNADQSGRLLEQAKFTFFFAPVFHPAMKRIAPIRKALGFRTIFNLLGPLANPIAPQIQLVGVSQPRLLLTMAQALFDLGIERALVVHSREGFDEISGVRPTDAYLVEREGLSSFTIEPANFGLEIVEAPLDFCGSLQENLQIFQQILQAKPTFATSAVILNAAYLIWLARVCDTPKDAIQLCRSKINDGSMQSFFNSWIEMAKNAERS